MTAFGIWDIRRQFPRSVPHHADLVVASWCPLMSKVGKLGGSPVLRWGMSSWVHRRSTVGLLEHSMLCFVPMERAPPGKFAFARDIDHHAGPNADRDGGDDELDHGVSDAGCLPGKLHE